MIEHEPRTQEQERERYVLWQREITKKPVGDAQAGESQKESPTTYREISRQVVDQGSTSEKEVVSPIAISK